MVYKLFLSFIFLTSLFVSVDSFASTPQDDEVNIVDAGRKKKGFWIYYGKDRPDLG